MVYEEECKSEFPVARGENGAGESGRDESERKRN